MSGALTEIGPLPPVSGLSEVTLRCADCFAPGGLASLEERSIDLVLADPPYCMKIQKWDRAFDFDRFFELLEPVLKPDGVVVMFSLGKTTARCMLGRWEGRWKYNMIWNKSHASGASGMQARIRPMVYHEDIMVFGSTRAYYRPQMREGFKAAQFGTQSGLPGMPSRTRRPGSTSRFPSSVLSAHSVAQCKTRHPTEKPVDLLRWLVRSFSPEDGVVLDPTMGSGSAGVAAIREGRDFVGIEMNREYYDVARARIKGDL